MATFPHNYLCSDVCTIAICSLQYIQCSHSRLSMYTCGVTYKWNFFGKLIWKNYESGKEKRKYFVHRIYPHLTSCRSLRKCLGCGAVHVTIVSYQIVVSVACLTCKNTRLHALSRIVGATEGNAALTCKHQSFYAKNSRLNISSEQNYMILY